MSSPNGFENTEVIAHYLRVLLAFKLGEGVEPPVPEWQLEFVEELHYCVKLVTHAIKNKSERNLSILQIMDKINEGKQRKQPGLSNNIWLNLLDWENVVQECKNMWKDSSSSYSPLRQQLQLRSHV